MIRSLPIRGLCRVSHRMNRSNSLRVSLPRPWISIQNRAVDDKNSRVRVWEKHSSSFVRVCMWRCARAGSFKGDARVRDSSRIPRSVTEIGENFLKQIHRSLTNVHALAIWHWKFLTECCSVCGGGSLIGGKKDERESDSQMGGNQVNFQRFFVSQIFSTRLNTLSSVRKVKFFRWDMCHEKMCISPGLWTSNQLFSTLSVHFHMRLFFSRARKPVNLPPFFHLGVGEGTVSDRLCSSPAFPFFMTCIGRTSYVMCWCGGSRLRVNRGEIVGNRCEKLPWGRFLFFPFLFFFFLAQWRWTCAWQC